MRRIIAAHPMFGCRHLEARDITSSAPIAVVAPSNVMSNRQGVIGAIRERLPRQLPVGCRLYFGARAVLIGGDSNQIHALYVISCSLDFECVFECF